MSLLCVKYFGKNTTEKICFEDFSIKNLYKIFWKNIFWTFYWKKLCQFVYKVLVYRGKQIFFSKKNIFLEKNVPAKLSVFNKQSFFFWKNTLDWKKILNFEQLDLKKNLPKSSLLPVLLHQIVTNEKIKRMNRQSFFLKKKKWAVL